MRVSVGDWLCLWAKAAGAGAEWDMQSVSENLIVRACQVGDTRAAAFVKEKKTRVRNCLCAFALGSVAVLCLSHTMKPRKACALFEDKARLFRRNQLTVSCQTNGSWDKLFSV